MGHEAGCARSAVWHLLCSAVWHLLCLQVCHLLCLQVGHLLCLQVWHLLRCEAPAPLCGTCSAPLCGICSAPLYGACSAVWHLLTSVAGQRAPPTAGMVSHTRRGDKCSGIGAPLGWVRASMYGLPVDFQGLPEGCRLSQGSVPGGGLQGRLPAIPSVQAADVGRPSHHTSALGIHAHKHTCS